MAQKKGPSSNTRAARRATSPSIDTDKSLKDVKPPSRTAASARPSVLAAHQSAGVQKKSKNNRKSQMSARARRRHEKGLEMAEAILERTSRKVEKSVGRGRNVKERSKAWDAINKAAEVEAADQLAEDKLAALEGEDGGAASDEEMNGADEKTLTAPATSEPVAAAPLPLDLDDDIL
ncbi:hypothetical protein AK830_g5769 [Neonectria ditissima]|uniref:Ribosome biogenesis protein Alb1 n=1 Tax=Neonectria ditissima TaxID=78410 RepID=A0A0P7BKH4_9HYPO|nr:hypothetical protein AK830_g5769 [Neonectria ditissima]